MKPLKMMAAALLLALLGGCASMPTGPSLPAMPGTGRSFGDFRVDDAQCRQYALQQVGGTAKQCRRAQRRVVGTAVGAAVGAAIGGHQGAGVGAGAGLLVGSVAGAEANRSSSYGSQRQYDDTYNQCMYAKGHKVPVSAAYARSLAQSPAQPAQGGKLPATTAAPRRRRHPRLDYSPPSR